MICLYISSLRVQVEAAVLEGGDLDAESFARLREYARKSGCLPKLRAMISNVMSERRRTSRAPSVGQSRATSSGRFESVTDEIVFEKAVHFVRSSFLSNRDIQAIVKEEHNLVGRVGVSFAETGNDKASVNLTTYFRSALDKPEPLGDLLDRIVAVCATRLKESRFLTEEELKKLDERIASGILPSSIFTLRYQKGKRHGAFWHKDAEAQFATVVVTMSTKADGIFIHPGSLDEVHKEIKLPLARPRERQFTPVKGGALIFRPGVAHMVKAMARRKDRVVLSLFF
jgi:hypothetical protein